MYTFLALGDSYTIGEGVLLNETYPYQAVRLLRGKGLPFTAPEIIARTGWTTDELNNAIAGSRLLPAYDFVTLLVGVNNQYRGRSCEEYKVQFQSLLQQAIAFAGGRPDRVFILSIPDWGVAPFAADRDRDTIARQIDAFNAAAKESAARQKVAFIDITSHGRMQGQPFAADGLHPAGGQYRFWAEELVEQITRQVARQ
ncbi:GDSL-type esterase/lipase family protein [Flavitalea sp. BT771]|uniref:SGNH/GDSL hydrolase family protein n=1 Tax=Flavitalea sp. BT771 TaxID=3063329 RepID=UPI0026E2CBAF|nr:GDSL-type esterase/lipase family protein [Flavitalea sp. BT771]MDO6434578.1 GDSL-type esterase/lipase family protein [Flavitalea sp. BT771]MDV6223478.1 GDSL-type esterase/lipase family protein [Flavitalea sp. BT771]